MLKTPSAIDPESERMRSKGISGTSGTLAQEVMSGYVQKRGLMLPTPMVIGGGACPIKDGKRIYHMDKKGGGFSARLHDMAKAGLLPGICFAQKEDGSGFRLSPLFTEEMMGFPFLWTTLPFLQLSGEQSPLKPTETP